MNSYMKEDRIKVKDGMDIDSIVSDMMSIIKEVSLYEINSAYRY